MDNIKLQKFRELMKDKGIDAYIIPSSDAHQSEYVSEYFKGRKWITNFTGSAGTAVITLDKAGLWTDGRYFIQAEEELKNTEFELFKMGEEGVLPYPEWIKSILPKNGTIGFDGKVISTSTFDQISSGLNEDNFKLDEDLLTSIWDDRPLFPSEKVFVYDLKYAGKPFSEKLEDVRKAYKNKGATAYIVSSLDDIAWLFNLRGSDIPNNTLFYSYALIEDEQVTLFIDSNKLDSSVKSYLDQNNIITKEYKDISNIINKLNGKKVYLSPTRTSIYVKSLLKNNEIITGPEITNNLKALKNKVEIENFKKSYINDSIALLRGFKYIEENLSSQKITEVDVADILLNERSKIDGFKSASFDTIAGTKEHGALMHFKANDENTYTLDDKGFLLVDSGGHYIYGTTDITRTFNLGTITPEEKKDFTLVLKSVIALSRAKFLKGTTGYKLDMIARYPLWMEGIDYKCGTGHGVGFFLNIHEGPQGFSVRPTHDLPLEIGMNLTIEPGVYKAGKHGIRIENTVVVKEAFTNENGTFYDFETLSYFPIDLDSIDKDLLNKDEIKWLNDYHTTTFEKLSPQLNPKETKWLKDKTKTI